MLLAMDFLDNDLNLTGQVLGLVDTAGNLIVILLTG
jgi:hypothetical protein